MLFQKYMKHYNNEINQTTVAELLQATGVDRLVFFFSFFFYLSCWVICTFVLPRDYSRSVLVRFFLFIHHGVVIFASSLHRRVGPFSSTSGGRPRVPTLTRRR